MSTAPESLSFDCSDGTRITAFRNIYGEYRIGDVAISYNERRARKRRWVASFCGLHFYGADPIEAFSALIASVRQHYLTDASTTLRVFGLPEKEARDV